MMIIPTSTGRVFVSEFSSMKDDKSPTELDDNDIFVQFVKDFWEKITTPGGDSDSLIISYAMLQFRLETRKISDPLRQYICTQLRQTPPDIVLIKDLDPKLSGFHQRSPNVWPYISIAKKFVDSWTIGIKHYPNKRETLATEALLKMTIIHETGHWHYTLGVGPYTEEMMLLRSQPDGFQQFQALPNEKLEEITAKRTPKSIHVPWNATKGESGHFAEYESVGGIMGFDLESETLIMRTGDGPKVHLVSTDYLIAFREHGILRFHPKTAVGFHEHQHIAESGMIRVRGKVTDMQFWPYTDASDSCSTSPSDPPTEFFGLGFNLSIRDCLSLEEMLLETAWHGHSLRST